MRHLISYCILLLVLCSCANMGNPDGGPYDEDPPKLVSTSPAFGAVNSKTKKIVLQFDENVKLDGANEKVVISPPQIEQPEIEASGKKITISLLDTLQKDATYTIDFADAIEDNNEGNPMGDYAFTFSTGETIDTMQVSGYVLSAENLEPVKGVVVGLYSMGKDSLGTNFSDTIVKTKVFERISRTDSRGHFIIKGVSRDEFYRIYAINDQDQTYTFSQKNEQIATTDRIIHTWSKPDIRMDTVWHDSVHYDSIVPRRFTHFYPDDIVLTAFTTSRQDLQLLKAERPSLEKLSVFFTAKSDSLPILRGLNYNSDSLFVVESNATKDTITYWIRDSLVFNMDTLFTEMKFMAHDTLDQLIQKTDSQYFVPKVTKAKLDKQKQQEYEDYVKDWKKEHKRELKDSVNMQVPPMPEVFLETKFSNTDLAPDKNIDITFAEPIDVIVDTMFHFTEKVDSNYVPKEYLLVQDSVNIRKYRILSEWEPDKEYQLQIDTGACVSIYGKRMAGVKKTIKIRPLDTFSTLFVKLINADTTAIVELLNSSDKPVKQVRSEGGKADFYFITPGTYYLRLFYDLNHNGVWDTGDYDTGLSPEPVYYYPKELVMKANWDYSEDWNPTAKELFLQKPAKITKQKADKEKKSTKSRNEERLKEKKNSKKKRSSSNGNGNSMSYGSSNY